MIQTHHIIPPQLDTPRILLTEISCADVLALSDILMEEVMVGRTGVEELELPSHLLPTKQGVTDSDALLEAAVQQVRMNSRVAFPGFDIWP